MPILRRANEWLTGRFPASPVLITAGLLWLGVAIWNFERELRSLAELLFPLAALVLTGGLSIGVVSLGYRLSKSRFDPDERWSIVGWALAGLIVTVLLQATTLAIRAAEGRPIGEPAFPLLVVGGVGAIAGFGIGKLLIDLRRTAIEAQEARDGMAFANSLLRHDVRNALQVMLGQVDVLARIDDERADDVGTRIESQVEALSELTESADAVTRVLTNEARPEPRDVVEDLQSAAAIIKESFPNATVETDIHDHIAVRGTDALKPVFTNILNNAVQHTGDGSTVRITTTVDDGSAILRIADDGPGIPDDQKSAIFQRGVTSDRGSSGLGLHIVSTLVERSSGSIHAEDSNLGGAAFVVELPLTDQ